MSNEQNPYGSPGGSMGGRVTEVTFGARPEAPQPAAATDAGGGDLVKDTTTAGFAADVIQESRNQPVLVDFWAPWCGPCKQLTPIIEKAVRAAGGRVKLVKMNIDDHPSIAGQLGIQSIPAVIAFKNGQPVDGFLGAVPETQVRDFIEKIGGKGGRAADLAEMLAAAREARAAGDAETAAGLFSAILAETPDNDEAVAGLGELLFEAGDVEAAGELLQQLPEGRKESAAITALRTRIALSQQAAALGDPAPLLRALEANPKDHQARFDLAMIQNERGQRDAAADNLLAIFKADRTWNEDAARAQLVKFFEAWGPMDEATLTARRKLSSLLFS